MTESTLRFSELRTRENNEACRSTMLVKAPWAYPPENFPARGGISTSDESEAAEIVSMETLCRIDER
jgi:hypothetical protein